MRKQIANTQAANKVNFESLGQEIVNTLSSKLSQELFKSQNLGPGLFSNAYYSMKSSVEDKRVVNVRVFILLCEGVSDLSNAQRQIVLSISKKIINKNPTQIPTNTPIDLCVRAYDPNNTKGLSNDIDIFESIDPLKREGIIQELGTIIKRCLKDQAEGIIYEGSTLMYARRCFNEYVFEGKGYSYFPEDSERHDRTVFPLRKVMTYLYEKANELMSNFNKINEERRSNLSSFFGEDYTASKDGPLHVECFLLHFHSEDDNYQGEHNLVKAFLNRVARIKEKDNMREFILKYSFISRIYRWINKANELIKELNSLIEKSQFLGSCIERKEEVFKHIPIDTQEIILPDCDFVATDCDRAIDILKREKDDLALKVSLLEIMLSSGAEPAARFLDEERRAQEEKEITEHRALETTSVTTQRTTETMVIGKIAPTFFSPSDQGKAKQSRQIARDMEQRQQEKQAKKDARSGLKEGELADPYDTQEDPPSLFLEVSYRSTLYEFNFPSAEIFRLAELKRVFIMASSSFLEKKPDHNIEHYLDVIRKHHHSLLLRNGLGKPGIKMYSMDWVAVKCLSKGHNAQRLICVRHQADNDLYLIIPFMLVPHNTYQSMIDTPKETQGIVTRAQQALKTSVTRPVPQFSRLSP